MNEKEIIQLNSFLRAFTWINSKSNHGYTFEIQKFPSVLKPEEAVNFYVSSFQYGKEVPKIVIHNYGSNWKDLLVKNLNKWLFEFQIDTFNDGRVLYDKFNDFSLSHESFRNNMIAELIQQFESIDSFISSFEIELVFENEFYECDYNDLLLLGTHCSLYIHFGVSD